MHLQLALASIRTSDTDDAKHHLEHFIDLATGDEKARGEEIIDMLEQGRIQDAEHEVEELLEWNFACGLPGMTPAINT